MSGFAIFDKSRLPPFRTQHQGGVAAQKREAAEPLAALHAFQQEGKAVAVRRIGHAGETFVSRYRSQAIRQDLTIYGNQVAALCADPKLISVRGYHCCCIAAFRRRKSRKVRYYTRNEAARRQIASTRYRISLALMMSSAVSFMV